MLVAKNWNMFAGDEEYKTNCFLKFRSEFTSMRFKHDKYQRLTFQIKAAICVSLLIVIAIYIFVWQKTSLKIYGCMLIHALLWHLLSRRCDALHLRACFLLLEYTYHEGCCLYLLPRSLPLHLLASHFPTFILGKLSRNPVDRLLVYVWYHHLGISLGLLLLKLISYSNQSVACAMWELLFISFSTTTFAFIERADKEMWVLYDSFKRSQRIYKRVVDGMPSPAFVADSTGCITYFNLHAHDIYGLAKKKGRANFLELVHEDQKKSVEAIIKRAVKEPTDSTEILLLNEDPSKLELQEESKAPPDLNYFLINKSTGCIIFRLQVLQGEDGEGAMEIGELRVVAMRGDNGLQEVV